MKDQKSDPLSASQDNESALRERVGVAIQQIMEPYFERYRENANRIMNLVMLYISLKQNPGAETHSTLDDILRASVVFTHATLEDFLRTLAFRLLPMTDEEILNQIPLLSLNTSGRPEKYLLGSLAQFRKKTVEDVIQESVMSFLQRSNYNNITDIVQLLKSLKVDVTKVDRSFSSIERLMERRHSIVHRADRGGSARSTTNDLLDIYPTDVMAWLEAVLHLIGDILSQTAVSELINIGFMKQEGNKFKIDS